MSEFNCTCEDEIHASHELIHGRCPKGGRIWGMDGRSARELEAEAQARQEEEDNA